MAGRKLLRVGGLALLCFSVLVNAAAEKVYDSETSSWPVVISVLVCLSTCFLVAVFVICSHEPSPDGPTTCCLCLSCGCHLSIMIPWLVTMIPFWAYYHTCDDELNCNGHGGCQNDWWLHAVTAKSCTCDHGWTGPHCDVEAFDGAPSAAGAYVVLMIVCGVACLVFIGLTVWTDVSPAWTREELAPPRCACGCCCGVLLWLVLFVAIMVPFWDRADLCDTQACSGHGSCQVDWLQAPTNASGCICDHGWSGAQCDTATCSGISCGPGRILKNTPTSRCATEGCTTAECCAAPGQCSGIACGPGRVMKNTPPSRCAAESCTKEECCTPEAVDVRARQRQALPRCSCRGASALADGSLACQVDGACNSETNITDEELWGCWQNNALCQARQPDCVGLAAEYTDDCNVLVAKEACLASIACAWAPPNTTLGWRCDAVNAASQAQCNTLASHECIAQSIACRWRSYPSPVTPCSMGEWRPCRASGQYSMVDVAAATCRAFSKRDDCEDQALCTWQDEGACECPDNVFGDACENHHAMWNDGHSLCSEVDADQEVCMGLILAAEFDADSARCLASATCMAWHETKRLLTMIYIITIVDMFNDCICVVMGAALLALKFIKGVDLKEQRQLGVAVAVVLAWAFLIDIIAEGLVIGFADASQGHLEELQGAHCFTTGTGFKTLVKMSDTAENIQTFGFINVAIAVVGLVGDCLDFREAVGAALLILATVGELLVSVLDLTRNTLELIDDAEAVEAALLGVSPLPAGHVCMQRHPDLPVASPTGVPKPVWILMVSFVVYIFLAAASAGCCTVLHGKVRGMIDKLKSSG